MRAVDLFAGAGGLSLGLQRAGWTIVGAVDNWDPAVDSYRKNFSHPMLKADACDIAAADLERTFGSLDDLDLVTGGPPCQGFSIQRIGSDDDSRNDLVHEYGRLVAELAPRQFLMENVPGLVGKRGRDLLDDFVRNMERSGYVVSVQTVDAVSFGVPQRRRRVLVYGSRDPLGRLDLVPSQAHLTTTVWDAIGDLPPAYESAVGVSDPLHVKSRMSDLNLQRLRLIPPGGGFEDLPVELRVPAHRLGASKIGHRNVYGRLAADEPAVTITARFDSFTRGRFAHPFADRNLTLREGARLQTFPDEFEFVGNREQIAALIGNAVPPELGAAIGRALAGE